MKGNTTRRITFQQFREGVLPMLAARKYPDLPPDAGIARLVALLLTVRAGDARLAGAATASARSRRARSAQAEGPMVNHVTMTDTDAGVYSKLTDSTQYTGEAACWPRASARGPLIPAAPGAPQGPTASAPAAARRGS